MNIWQELPKPFFVLAPMDDVTDTVFRRVIARAAKPDLFFTEFANADGLQSSGRAAVLRKLQHTEAERPLIAQLWGLKPDNFAKTAQQLGVMGFAGLDLNMGCPVKNVVSHGACAALIKNRELASDIITASQTGGLPVSVKTRLGFGEVDLTWVEFILSHKIAALTIHGRIAKEMSKFPAQWELIKEVVKLRDEIAPGTVIIGNGDVLTREQGLELAMESGVDGVMVGRGIFKNPWLFEPNAKVHTKTEQLELFLYHLDLFEQAWGQTKNPHSLRRFAKVYTNGWPGASALREAIMTAKDAAEIRELVAIQLTSLAR